MFSPICFTNFFHEFYVIFVLIFKLRKKSLTGPIRNFLSFSTSQNWEILGKIREKKIVKTFGELIIGYQNTIISFEYVQFNNFGTYLETLETWQPVLPYLWFFRTLVEFRTCALKWSQIFINKRSKTYFQVFCDFCNASCNM